MRKIKFFQAINEAQHQIMKSNDKVIQIGQGINSPWYVGQTMINLLERFGKSRMIDTPLSESAITGMAIGAAIAGLRPILTFPRMDFMYYAMDQLCNHAASFDYSLGDNSPIPLIVRAIINRKGEQGAQHSQALHGLFMHIPNLKIIMPSNAYDAKGMLLSAFKEKSVVLFIEDRELYNYESEVPEEMYDVNLNKANLENKGSDITIVSSSYLLQCSARAVDKLKTQKINADLIDLRSIKPIDYKTISNSVKKTKRLIVVDGGWSVGGISSEIISYIATQDIDLLSAPKKISLPDLPALFASSLEKLYYPDLNKIYQTVIEIFSKNK